MLKVNNHEVEYHIFPNGELQINPNFSKDIKYKNLFIVELIYENTIDFNLLLFVKKYLDDNYSDAKVNLIMKYIPYSRMDRSTPNQMFTCKYFCQIINSLKFNRVFVLDPHSNVCLGGLEKVIQLNLNDYVRYVINKEGRNGNYIDAIFLPDVGAYKKYTEILEDIDLPKFWGNKHRDLNTGAISDYSIVGDVDVKDKNILIVDDICVKGYTTLFASKKLKELGSKRVIFYCSHCEDAILDGQLLKTDYVDKIYTTNSLNFSKFVTDKKIEILNF